MLPLSSCEIGLLIGCNCSQALLPREVVPPDADGPFGLRTILGSSIVGIVKQGCIEEDSIGLSHCVLAHEVPLELLVGGKLRTFRPVFLGNVCEGDSQ